MFAKYLYGPHQIATAHNRFITALLTWNAIAPPQAMRQRALFAPLGIGA